MYGKLASVVKTTGTVTYGYDASGNRVSKTINGVTTFYTRDAQGNVMGIYENTSTAYNWKEQDIYGSSRLGMLKPGISITGSNNSALFNGAVNDHAEDAGNRLYDLTNHLGNVMVTVSDIILNPSAGVYLPSIVSSQDYYSFGSTMPGRTYGTPGRYAFNGKEKDQDIDEEDYDYGMRIHDARLGRFLSVDPISKNYPELSTYQYASNTPIQAIDLDGLEAVAWEKYLGFTVSKPKLNPGEWYEIANTVFSTHYSTDYATFKEAAVYNSLSKRSNVYGYVSERHDFYSVAQDLLNEKGIDSKWFSAASTVTAWNAVGGVESDFLHVVLGKTSSQFLEAGNRFLFAGNMENFNQLYQKRKINTTFTTAAKSDGTTNTIWLGGLKGKKLDYALVEYEQTQVQKFIDSYSAKNPKTDMKSIFTEINKAFGSPFAPGEIQDVIKTNFTDKNLEFDFGNYEHRVILGQKLVDAKREDK